MGAVFGKKITLTIFGESHGVGIGCVLGNLPAGIKLDYELIAAQMKRRAPGNSPLATARKEADEFEILSGVFNGHTTGAPLCMLIKNSTQRSNDYNILQDVMRPGHADYTGRIKYKGFNDYRGGGHFSGRLTAPLVFAGAVARQVLTQKGICIGAHIKSIANITDQPLDSLNIKSELLEQLSSAAFPTICAVQGQLMQQQILKAKNNLDSVGGVIECAAINIPAGLGEPFFDSLESQLASLLFSIPAVKGVSFGAGFSLTELHGSQANDPMHYQNGEIKFASNNNGGILGGISNGLPMVFSVAIKPTPSIYQEQDTINITSLENYKLQIHGRHDPCIVQRAVPVVEAAAAWVILDNLIAEVCL